ncbi:MAG: Rieske 2Fe-2S domain-containing protein, partial [Alphaproteobacteria bacterium]
IGMTPEENERLTRVGPGTPAGEMLRRYWWPVWFTEQLTEKPVPIRILGEDLVAFRDGAGRAGLLDARCPHRGTALTLGRAEERGLRCCYHGWLFATDGQCLEQPGEPDGKLAAEVRHTAYKVKEISGLVFAYLGPDPVPCLPPYDLLYVEGRHRIVRAGIDNCNWLQRAENGVDPMHSMALHAAVYPDIALKRPEVEWTRTWYGFRQISRYPGQLENVSHQIFPSHTRRFGARTGDIPSHYMHFRVPADDVTTTTFYLRVYADPTGDSDIECKGMSHHQRGVYRQVDDGWWGIASHDQDRIAQESQGLIHDRSRETLGTSDQGVVMLRRMLSDSIDKVARGEDPMGIVRDEGSQDVITFDAGKNFGEEKAAPMGVPPPTRKAS